MITYVEVSNEERDPDGFWVKLRHGLNELRAGLPAPSGLDGASFAGALRVPSAPTKPAVFHVYPRDDLLGRAVRTERYRLVEWKRIGEPAERAVCELYDYASDPDETRNLAVEWAEDGIRVNAVERPEVVAQLRAMLASQPEAKPQIGKAATAAGGAQKPRQDRAAMFAARDLNGDAQLSREEFLRNQPDPEQAPKRFELFDSDRNGTLSREEFIRGGRR